MRIKAARLAQIRRVDYRAGVRQMIRANAPISGRRFVAASSRVCGCGQHFLAGPAPSAECPHCGRTVAG